MCERPIDVLRDHDDLIEQPFGDALFRDREDAHLIPNVVDQHTADRNIREWAESPLDFLFDKQPHPVALPHLCLDGKFRVAQHFLRESIVRRTLGLTTRYRQTHEFGRMLRRAR